MENVLIRHYIMNNISAVEKTVIGLDKPSLSYNYQISKSITEQRGQYNNFCGNKNYLNKSFKPFKLIHFSYKGIDYSMITCPSGGKVELQLWGKQEIKQPFMLGETEVTQELFEAVMGFNYSYFKNPKNPVENVSWYDCIEFCNILSDYFGLEHCYLLSDKRLHGKCYTKSDYPLSIEDATFTFVEGANGFRLPREWEWQIAAMAKTKDTYAGANDEDLLKKVAWFRINSCNKSHPVAQKLPNKWGFYDMSGNVAEWCENSFESDNNDNPSAKRSIRGGKWYADELFLRCATPDDYPPDRHNNGIGFRIAKSI